MVRRFKNKNKKRIIGIDFDGVLHSYTRGWTGVVPEDSPVEGAINFLITLSSQDADIYITSSRCLEKGGKQAIKQWLLKYGFPKDKINRIGITHEKIPYDILLDDRGLRFDGKFPPIKTMMFLNSWTKERKSHE